MADGPGFAWWRSRGRADLMTRLNARSLSEAARVALAAGLGMTNGGR